jgi:hypothetical protein
VIDNPASCEIRAVIRFLHAKNTSAAETHREWCAVYGQNVMSEETVRQWYRMFKDVRTNVHDETRTGRPSVVSDDLVQSVDQKKKLWKTALHNFTAFLWIYPNYTHSSLRDYCSYARLSQVLRNIGSENAHGCAQNAENGFSFETASDPYKAEGGMKSWFCIGVFKLLGS